MRPALFLAVLLALAACGAGTDDAYPKLVPISQLLAPEAVGTEPDPAAGGDARAAALRDRAERLRDPVIPPGTMPAPTSP